MSIQGEKVWPSIHAEHLQNEEAIMAEYQQPDAGQHKVLHVRLGAETLMPLELAPFVRNWLYDHIRVHDMRLVAFIHLANGAERQPVAV